MTVKELRNLLTKLCGEYGDCQVILSKDGEGNHYSPLAGDGVYTLGRYEPEETWFGYFNSGEDQGGATNALCLWPVN